MPSPRPYTTVVVDDSHELRSLWRLMLEYDDRFAVVAEAADGRSGVAAAELHQPDLVLLDIAMPGIDGYETLRRIRAFSDVPVIMLSARDGTLDKVKGLELGADDYVTKPFDLRELLARIKAVLRRVAPADAAPVGAGAPADARSKLRFAGWQLDTAARSLRNPQGEQVPLTGGEFDLLQAFARHPGRVLSRDFLLGQTRGREAAPFDRTIDVQVGRLRKKIEADADDPQLIKSVRGAGYILVPAVTTG